MCLRHTQCDWVGWGNICHKDQLYNQNWVTDNVLFLNLIHLCPCRRDLLVTCLPLQSAMIGDTLCDFVSSLQIIHWIIFKLFRITEFICLLSLFFATLEYHWRGGTRCFRQWAEVYLSWDPKNFLGSWDSFCVGGPVGYRWQSYHGVHGMFLATLEASLMIPHVVVNAIFYH